MDTSYDYHKAILHIDGDAFFASCEQSTNRSLRNKAIAVGKERGAATAFSYEAKRMGVKRGMSIKDLVNEYPEVQLVSSNYKKYSLFSSRMKEIVSRYTHRVEKTSIDECYADITGLDLVYGKTYYELIKDIQDELSVALGMTFSIGIGPSKKIAKIGSGLNKPHGITVINHRILQEKIYKLQIEKVPGIGYRTAPKMHAYQIYTIGDFVKMREEVVSALFSKPYQETHKELQGHYINPLELEQSEPKSISKIHAFEKLTNNNDFLLGELSRHCEVIAKKLRRYNLGTTKIYCSLKTFNERTVSQAYVFDSPVDDAQILFSAITELFLSIKKRKQLYRATSVSVHGLRKRGRQESLFQDTLEIETLRDNSKLLSVLDSLEEKFGTGIVSQGSSNKNTRDTKPHKDHGLLYCPSGKKILYLLYLGEVS